MNEQRVRGLMGLCVRAGQAVFGADGCMRAIREGKAAALLMEQGIAENARKKYESLCGRAGIPALTVPAGWIGESTGRPGAAMALRPGSLAEQMIQSLREAG